MLACDASIPVLLAPARSTSEAVEVLEDCGYLERSASPGAEHVVRPGGRLALVRVGEDALEALGSYGVEDPLRVEAGDGVYLLVWRDLAGDCLGQGSAQARVAGSLRGRRIVLASEYCIASCVHRTRIGSVGVGARPISGDLFHVCLVVDGEWREGDVHAGEPGDIAGVLGIDQDLAGRVSAWLRSIGGPQIIYCLREVDGDCVRALAVRWVGDYVEVFIESEARESTTREFLALLPSDIRLFQDEFYRAEYYVAYRGGRVVAIAEGLDEFVSALKNSRQGFVIERPSKEVQLAVRALARRARGYLTPGITPEGIVSPNNELDLGDYGVQGLIEAYRWVDRYYGVNGGRALANIALLLAKVISPVIRRESRTFVDEVAYNQGPGGVGKSSLVRYVLEPLLGADAISNYITISGPVRTDAQFRNLLSLHRLPLILDEQDLRSLTANAGIILGATVGSQIIGVQAAKYGLGIGARFMSLRGVMVFTNVPFTRFLARAVDQADARAFARRFIVIEWEDSEVGEEAFRNLPTIKPILGALDRAFRRYREELYRSSNITELARKLLIALAREYGDGDARAVIEEYVEALDEVVREAVALRRGVVEDDWRRLVRYAYEFVREDLGKPITSAREVIEVLISNPTVSGIELAGARYGNEVAEVQDRVLEMYHARSIDELIRNPDFPTGLLRALQEGLVYVRIHAGGLGGRVPNARRFLGRERIHNPRTGAHYYTVRLDEFLRAFQSMAEEDQANAQTTG